jgi:hypothetical protein
MHSSLAQELLAFTEPNSEAQLRRLEEALASVDPSRCGDAEFEALLSVFERFPESDGFGVFWSIVHLLEACSGYEPVLLASVARKPVEFNLLMVNRLLNSGIREVHGQSLVQLLSSVRERENATARSRKVAQDFLEYQQARGGSGA